MINVDAIHASGAGAAAKYFYQGTVGQFTMLDAVLAMANGYPDEGHELLDWDQMQRSLAAVRDPAFVEAFPIRWRPDMPQRLEDLLRVDRDLAPDFETVRRLLAGNNSNGNPIEGKRYGPVPGGDRVTALSLTFSAGKTVSIAWAAAPPEIKHEIRRAHQAAVETALRGIEEHIAVLRVRPDREERGEVAWVTFFQTTGSRGDPQLHSHVAILNAVASRESDRVGSLYYLRYHGLNTHFREVYQQELAANLDKTGLSTTYDRENREAVVNNVPREAVHAFSKAKNEAISVARSRIEATGQNFDDLSVQTQQRLVKQAVLDNRKTTEVGIGDWTAEIDALGWNPAQLYENHRIQKALEAPERRAFGLRLPDGGYHVGGEREMDWGITR